MGSENRQKRKIISVRVELNEYEIIRLMASQCDLAPSTYLRNLGIGHEPKSHLDAQVTIELAKLNADLGRLGGLLKIWLSDGNKKDYGKQLNIPQLINEIRDLKVTIENKVLEL